MEQVLEVMEEPNRTAHVALVGSGDKLRYIIATENMKPGDLITTTSELTRIAGIRKNHFECFCCSSNLETPTVEFVFGDFSAN